MFERILKNTKAVAGAPTEQTNHMEKALKLKQGKTAPPADPHYQSLGKGSAGKGQIRKTDIRASKSGTFVEGISRSRGNRSGDQGR